MKFSPEKYFKNGDKDGDWYKVSIDDTSYYTLLGFKLNDQFSTEDIDGAYRDRYECWEDVRKGRDTGKSLISRTVVAAGPKVDEAFTRLKQAQETLRDIDKRRTYDQALLEKKQKPLIDLINESLNDRILSKEGKQTILRMAATLGIDQTKAEELISTALVKAGATYQPEPPSALNYYKQLGVPDFSDYPEIKKKYEDEHAAYINKSAGAKAAAKFHYDKVIEAFEVLKNADRRRAHDEELKAPKGPVPLGVPVLTLVPDAPTYEFKNIRRGVTLSETIVIRNSEAGLLQGDIKTDADAKTWLKPDRDRLAEKHEQPLVLSVITANIPRNVFHARGTVTITTNGGIANVPFDVFLEDYGTELLRFKSAYVPLVASFIGLVGSIISGTQLVWLIWPSVLVFAVWNQIQLLNAKGIAGNADRIKAIVSSFALGAVAGWIASLVVGWIAPSLPHLSGFVVGAWLGGFLCYLLAQRLFDGGITLLFTVPHSSLILRGLAVAITGMALMLHSRDGENEPARTNVSTPKFSVAAKLSSAEQCMARGDLVCATAAIDEVLRVEPRNITVVGIRQQIAIRAKAEAEAETKAQAQAQAQAQARVTPAPAGAITPGTPVTLPAVVMAFDPRTGCNLWRPAIGPNDAVTWSGPCVGGFAEGHGIAQWTADGKNTYSYEGTFHRGLLQGRGKMTVAGGDRYEGDYRDGKREGHGVYISGTGERYEGEFRDNKRDGRGTLTRADGIRVEGNFTHGKLPADAAPPGAREPRATGQDSAEAQRRAATDDAALRALSQQEERERVLNQRAEASRKDADDATTRSRAQQVERERIQLERTEEARQRSERLATAQADYLKSTALAQREYQQLRAIALSRYQQKQSEAQRVLQRESSEAQREFQQSQSIAQAALQAAQNTGNQVTLLLLEGLRQQSVAIAQSKLQAAQSAAQIRYQQALSAAQAELNAVTGEAEKTLQQRTADAQSARQLAGK